MSVEASILEIIKKNLPEATAGELKTYMNEAEQTKKDLAKAQKEIEKAKEAAELAAKNADIADKKIKALESQIKHQWEIAQKLEETKKIEASIEKMQYQMDLTLAREKNLMLENQQNSFMKLMEIVFRNPKTVTNQSVSHNTNDNYRNTYVNGEYVDKKSGEFTTVETKTIVEETKD